MSPSTSPSDSQEFQVKGKYNLVDTEDDLRAAFRCDGVEIARTALLRRNKRKTVTFACCYDMQDSKAVTYPLDFGPLVSLRLNAWLKLGNNR